MPISNAVTKETLDVGPHLCHLSMLPNAQQLYEASTREYHSSIPPRRFSASILTITEGFETKAAALNLGFI
jgi:hypothetical protein